MVRNTPQRLLWILCLCGVVFAATPGVWLDVPFIKQEKDGCGAASIAMVMQYWRKQQTRPVDRSADAVEIQRALYSSKDHGIRASDLEHYFRQNGFQTFAFAGKWEDLKQHLEKGRPLIVALKPSALETSLHYVVVVGIDPAQDIVYLNDAAQRKLLKQERASFENQWSAVGHWTLLALPK
ncbi:MAG TPA: C39 family peptidase [Candidatus Angelobacter sp.]|jgi:ABC-type bacteriocin/lantibiotic exporter with double-glycine peptidase domain